jgi:peptide-methionine (S)-S-oxide reductase
MVSFAFRGAVCGALAVLVVAGCGRQVPAQPRRALAEVRGGGGVEKATFGAGCFWGVEETFRNVRGVRSTTAGYLGGHVENPTYEQVCGGRTGHTEVCQVEYDPALVSYADLLAAFWTCHDPTQVNRQGPDVGWQYRSVIFCHTPEQKAAAEASKAGLQRSGAYRRPIATAIEAAAAFWPAEEYHQQYLSKQGIKTCH